MLSFRRIKKALLIHYSADNKKVFKQFRDGGIYFGVGLMTVLMAGHTMDSSTGQELLVLLGLIMACAGFVIAMLAQIRLLISRILHFYRRK